MKKFIVDRTEIRELGEGTRGIYSFDKEGNDWYEEQKGFRADTLKVLYNKDTLHVWGTSMDASMIAPTMVGDVVEEIEYQEVQVNPNLYLVKGKLTELAEYEVIKNGKVAFDREGRTAKIEKELQELKIEHSEKPFIFKEKYMQKNRDLDKNNLTSIVVMCNATKQQTFKGWKFKDKDDNDIYVDLTLADMMILAKTMQEQTTKAMKTESILISKLGTLSDEELKSFNPREEYEKVWNS